MKYLINLNHRLLYALSELSCFICLGYFARQKIKCFIITENKALSFFTGSLPIVSRLIIIPGPIPTEAQ